MLDPRIERMLQETEQQSSLSPGAAKDLREAVESSPYLVEVMTKAIDNGDLEHIRFAHTHNEGGHYNHAEKTISVNADVLQRPARSERIDQLTGVLGHETGHALMARSNEISTYKLSYRIDEALKEGARYGDATVDITPLAKDYINASRENEALAELVSMNSVASRVKHQDPNVTDAELLHRLDPTTPCVTNGRLAQGIQMDAQGIQHTDNRIDSPAISAVAICQFDQSGKGLGTLGRSDYNAYYLSYAVSAGAAVSRDLDRASSQPIPSLGLNLKELGASAEEIQAAGVSLGGQGKTFGFTDTSGRQLRPSEVRQVGKGDAGQPDLAPNPSPVTRPCWPTVQRTRTTRPTSRSIPGCVARATGTTRKPGTSRLRFTSSRWTIRCSSEWIGSPEAWGTMALRTSLRSMPRTGWTKRRSSTPTWTVEKRLNSRPSKTSSKQRSSSRTKCVSSRWNKRSNRRLSRNRGRR